MNSKTVFNPDWTDEQLNLLWAEWIEDVPNNLYVASCLLCKKMFSLSNMDKQGLTSYEEGKKTFKKD